MVTESIGRAVVLTNETAKKMIEILNHPVILTPPNGSIQRIHLNKTSKQTERFLPFKKIEI